MLQSLFTYNVFDTSCPVECMEVLRHVFPLLQDIAISKDEMDYMIDLRSYLTPNPYTIGPVSVSVALS